MWILCQFRIIPRSQNDIYVMCRIVLTFETLTIRLWEFLTGKHFLWLRIRHMCVRINKDIVLNYGIVAAFSYTSYIIIRVYVVISGRRTQLTVSSVFLYAEIVGVIYKYPSNSIRLNWSLVYSVIKVSYPIFRLYFRYPC